MLYLLKVSFLSFPYSVILSLLYGTVSLKVSFSSFPYYFILSLLYLIKFPYCHSLILLSCPPALVVSLKVSLLSFTYVQYYVILSLLYLNVSLSSFPYYVILSLLYNLKVSLSLFPYSVILSLLYLIKFPYCHSLIMLSCPCCTVLYL